MTDAATFLRAEIARHDEEISDHSAEILKRQKELARCRVKVKALRRALSALEPGAGKAGGKKTTMRKGRGEHMLVGTYTVNGVDLHLGAVQFNILETLDKAEDCVQRSALEPFCNGDRKALHQAIFNLKAKLRLAGATIEFFPGEGYRLQNIEEGA